MSKVDNLNGQLNDLNKKKTEISDKMIRLYSEYLDIVDQENFIKNSIKIEEKKELRKKKLARLEQLFKDE